MSTRSIVVSLLCVLSLSPVFAQDAPPPEAVFVTDVIEETFPESLEFSGGFTAYNAVTLKAEAPGRIDTIHFKDGTKVKAGAPLFSMNDREAQANLTKAQATFTVANAQLERKQALKNKGFVAQAELDKTMGEKEAAASDVALAQEALNKKHMKAPFEGILSNRRVSKGASVNTNDELVDFYDLTPLRFTFEIPESQITFAHQGQDIEVLTDAYEGEIFKGKIESIDPAINPKSRSIRVHARFENADERLKPGLFGHIKLFGGETHPALSIPESALVFRQDGISVFVMASDNKVALRKVSVGTRANDRAEILSGLKKGDAVITRGQDKVYEGASVIPTKTPPTASVK